MAEFMTGFTETMELLADMVKSINMGDIGMTCAAVVVVFVLICVYVFLFMCVMVIWYKINSVCDRAESGVRK